MIVVAATTAAHGSGNGDQGLELVASCLALPQMANAMPVQILGPFRQEERLPALGTPIQQPGLSIFPGALGSELHDVPSAMCLPLSLEIDGIAIDLIMKQQP